VPSPAAVAVEIVVPLWLSVRVEPLPSDAGVMLPDTCHVCAVAVNAGTVAGALATVTL